MSTLTIALPDSVKKRIEALAAAEGYTVRQFLAIAPPGRSGRWC